MTPPPLGPLLQAVPAATTALAAALPPWIGPLVDLVAVFLLALGLKGLGQVRSARGANGLAALAMGLAVLGLLLQIRPDPQAWLWIAVGCLGGSLAGVVSCVGVPGRLRS